MIAIRGGKQFQIYYSLVLITLGVDRTFPGLPHFFRFLTEKPLLSPDGTSYERIEAHIYNYDPLLAPAGKTVVGVALYTKNASWWINARNENREQYNDAKRMLTDEVIRLLDKKIGGIAGHIEAQDTATPATFHRYTGNYQGSVQGWLPDRNIMKSVPVDFKFPGLGQFYYCGHWTRTGGGLPVAVKSARDVAQNICYHYRKTNAQRNGRYFRTKA